MIKLKGRAFAEFERSVIPLMDGHRTFEQIGREVSDLFTPSDLETALEFLANQNLLEDGDVELPPNQESVCRFTPQLNFFHEIGLNPLEAQRRLHGARVTIFGLGGAGPQLAESLANTGVGYIRCVDGLRVSTTDLYLTATFGASDLGSIRSTVIERRCASQFPETKFESAAVDMNSDEAMASAVAGSDYVVSCLDIGLSSFLYRLNRIC